MDFWQAEIDSCVLAMACHTSYKLSMSTLMFYTQWLLVAWLIYTSHGMIQSPSMSARGGGACSEAKDCQLAGLCTNGNCVCDPGWTGNHCELLDLAPLDPHSKTTLSAWNSEDSPRSSWGAAPIKGSDGKYHGWFNQLPEECGLSSWLPGTTE